MPAASRAIHALTAASPEPALDGSAMPTPDHNALPDVAVGHHPEYGIVAANPKQLVASTWMLQHLDFHPAPKHPTLYTLANQQQDGPGRAARAVALLRRAGYQVAVDHALDPAPVSGSARARDRPPLVEPDVAFAEHPQFGIVAATADTIGAVERGGAILESHGWRFNHALDIYTLPVTTDRGESLGTVAAATVSMHRSNLRVAVQPLPAQDVVARRPSAPASAASHGASADVTTYRFPRSAAALASSPALAGLPGKAPAAVPALRSAAQPVDPRIAVSRNR